MTTNNLISKPAAAREPEALRVVAALQSGEPFVCLRDDDVQARAATLAAILQACGDVADKIIWIGNPLRSPLTVERFFLQAAGPEVDVRLERDPARLAQMLAEACGGTRRLMVVQQPETIDGELRELLSDMGPLLSRVQVLFCGSTSFRPLAPATAVTGALVALGMGPRPRQRTRSVGLLLVAGLVATGGSTAWFLTQGGPADPKLETGQAQAAPLKPPAVTEPDQAEAPSAAAPPALRPEVSLAPANGGEAVVNVSSLRQQFEQFLTERSPRLASLSPSQREALFQEFLRSRNIRSP